MTDPTAERFVSSHARGQGKAAWFRLLCELGSVRMAATLIATLAAVIAAATLYERAYGAQVAAVMVYQAWWFTALFALLAGCLIAAVAVRLPLRRHQWGFAVVHLGLLVLMGGFWAHGHSRLDGMLEAHPGSEASRIDLPSDALTVIDGDRRDTATFQPIALAGYPSLLGFLVRDLWLDPPARVNRLARPRQLIGTPQLRAELLAVLDTGGSELGFAPAAAGPPAVLLSLAARSADGPLQPFARTWLAPGRQTLFDQGLVVGSLMVAASPHAADGFLAPVPPAGAEGELVVALADRSLRLPVEALREHALGDDLALRIDRVLTNPRPVGNQLEQDPAARFDPVVEYSLGRGPAASRTWTPRLAAGLLLAPGGDGLPEVRYEHPRMFLPGEGQGAFLQLLALPDRSLQLRWFTRSKGLAGTARIAGDWRGELVGGPMQLHAEIHWLPHAAAAPEPVAMQAGRQDRAQRWVQVRFSDGDAAVERWLRRDEVAAITLGKREVFASYRRAVYDLRAEHGFALRLDRFDVGKDPGGMRSASYRSEVTVLPAGGQPYPAEISMNQPLHHGGVTLYQTAFREETDGAGHPTGRQISIFTAATDPGRPLKYLGSLLLVGGIVLLYALRRNRSA